MRVTTHMRKKLETGGATDLTRRSLIVVPTRDGKSFYRNGGGECWRTFVFVEGVQTFEAVQSPAQAFQAGKAFGEFQHLLVDLPDERLSETIPHFHHTRKRFGVLKNAIECDHFNRAKFARPEIEFAMKHESLVDVILPIFAFTARTTTSTGAAPSSSWWNPLSARKRRCRSTWIDSEAEACLLPV
jgi:hypothetical protein